MEYTLDWGTLIHYDFLSTKSLIMWRNSNFLKLSDDKVKPKLVWQKNYIWLATMALMMKDDYNCIGDCNSGAAAWVEVKVINPIPDGVQL